MCLTRSRRDSQLRQLAERREKEYEALLRKNTTYRVGGPSNHSSSISTSHRPTHLAIRDSQYLHHLPSISQRESATILFNPIPILSATDIMPGRDSSNQRLSINLSAPLTRSQVQQIINVGGGLIEKTIDIHTVMEFQHQAGQSTHSATTTDSIKRRKSTRTATPVPVKCSEPTSGSGNLASGQEQIGHPKFDARNAQLPPGVPYSVFCTQHSTAAGGFSAAFGSVVDRAERGFDDDFVE